VRGGGRSDHRVSHSVVSTAAAPPVGVPWRPAELVTLTYREGTAQVPPTSGPTPATQFGPAPPSLAARWPSLPRPGQLLPVALPDAQGIRVRVEGHSRPVAHAVIGTDCAVGSAVVVLRIDGDPATVLSAYRRQFASLVTADDAAGSGVQRGHTQGTRVLRVSVLGDLTTYTLTGFVRKGRPTWGLLETCNE